jgi:HEPN domain-containing protein
MPIHSNQAAERGIQSLIRKTRGLRPLLHTLRLIIYIMLFRALPQKAGYGLIYEANGDFASKLHYDAS